MELFAVNWIFLALLSLVEVGAFSDCGYEASSTKENIIDVFHFDLKERDSHHLEVSFKGTSLVDLTSLLARVELSFLGIKMFEEQYHYCHNSINNQRRSALRTSSDETPACSFRKGEQIEGQFLISIDEDHLKGLNYQYKLVLSAGTHETCSMDERLLVPKHENSFLSRRLFFTQEEVDRLWNLWVSQHGDSLYLPPEFSSFEEVNQYDKVSKRRSIFEENLLKIALHNAKPSNTYSMAMNQFGHLTFQEFKRYYATGMRSGADLASPRHSSVLKRNPHKRLPSKVNWVRKGAVTSVKNQGICGSCWSFSATGALEGAYFLKTGNLVSFSEQELVSCDNVDLGCDGGLMDNAWQFAALNNGLCSEDSFPYTSADGTRGECNTSCSPVKGSTPQGIIDVYQDERSLEEAVAMQPVAVAIEADEMGFQFYSSGVLSTTCSTSVDHGVLAVGYGKDPDQDMDYWLVKNSWGATWGLNGYVKIERGVNSQEGGECGILISASFPEL